MGNQIAVSEQFCCSCKAIILLVPSPCSCARPPFPGLQNGPVKPPCFDWMPPKTEGSQGSRKQEMVLEARGASRL